MGLFQDTDLLSPGVLANAAHGGGGGGGGGGGLESSRHLSRSNIDIPRSSGTEDPKRQLPRKRSDSSTYELDTIQQHQAFLSRCGAGGGLRVRPCGSLPGDSENQGGPEPRIQTRSCPQTMWGGPGTRGGPDGAHGSAAG